MYKNQKFLNQGKVAPCHSLLLSILTRNWAEKISDHIREDDWQELLPAAILVTQETETPPQAHMCVYASSSATVKFYSKTTLLDPNSLLLHVIPGMMQHNWTHVLLAIIYDSSQKTQHWEIHIISGLRIGKLRVIVKGEEYKSIKNESLHDTESTVPTVHSSSLKFQELWIEHHVEKHSSDEKQEINNRRREYILSQSYSRNLQKVLQIMERSANFHVRSINKIRYPNNVVSSTQCLQSFDAIWLNDWLNSECFNLSFENRSHQLIWHKWMTVHYTSVFKI